MKSRNNPRSFNAGRRRKSLGRTRAVMFTLALALVAAAVTASNLVPSRSLYASAQQGNNGNGNGVGNGNGNGAEQMSEKARRQIEGLMHEKAARSHGRKKMDSRLIYGIKQRRGEKIADDVDSLLIDLPVNERGDVMLDITAEVTKDFLKKLKSAGAKVLGSYPESNSVRVEVSLDAVDEISEFPEVVFVQPKQDAMTQQDSGDEAGRVRTGNPGFGEPSLSAELTQALEEFQLNSYNVGGGGVRKSEADVTHRAALARNTYGADGTGIKIGVLSDGVRYLSAAQAAGDLGPVTVLAGQSGTSAGQCVATNSCDEGTAMLEIVHDIAPGAQLYFATAFGGSANFANNIRQLRNAGCDIIVDDVFYFAESPFQDGQAPGIVSPTNGGIVAQAVSDVTAAGALYFSSAGNSGNKNDGTSGVWEGDFVDGGPLPAAISPFEGGVGRVHQFPGGLTTNLVTVVGSSQYNLNWSDPLGGSSNDYDLFAINSTGAVIAASTGSQSGTQDPFEAISPVAAGSRIVIVKYSGASRYLRLSTNRGQLATNTAGQTTGHSTAAGAFGVAAVPAIGTFPNPFTAANQVETYSSDGPRKLFYQANGTPFTPSVLAAGGISRQKPDIAAADRVSVTGAGGFGITFSGTSAAAPHAAAIAALLKSANPTLTSAQVRDALQNTAIDNEAAGIDRDSGYGIIMADSALQYVGAASVAGNVNPGTATVSEVGGNGDGFISPGERGTVSVPLVNTGNAPATAVTATISSATPGVVVTPSATRAYPDVAATNGTSASAAPFEFVYQQTGAYASNIDFNLTVTYNGVTRVTPFRVPTGNLSIASTTLDATAPVVPANAVSATTGTQVGRLAFTYPASTCGSAKANPGVPAGTTAARRYDAYTYVNASASPICVTVAMSFAQSVLAQTTAYIDSFNPSNIATNYLADNGGSTGQGAGNAQLFSFTVPAGRTFVVVVDETNSAGAPNMPYTLRVSGLPAAAVPANLPPVNTVAGAQSVLEDNALVFSGAGGNAVSVADPDAGNNPVEVTLASTNGALTLGGTSGLTFTAGGGANDAAMTFRGSVSDINNALNGLSYSPAANYNGPATLTVTTNDLGNTGTGSAGSDTDAVTVNVTPVNDAPGFTAGLSQTVLEDSGAQTVTAWATGMNAGPADESAQALDFVVTNDNPSLFSVQPSVAPDGTLSYTPAADTNGTANVAVKIHDGGGTTNGGVDTSAPQSFAINVTAVNDAPVFTYVPTAVTILEQNVYAFTALASDVDSASLTYSLAGEPAGATITPSGAFTWTPTEAQGGTGSSYVFTVRVSDGITSTDSQITINVTEVNQNPVLNAIGNKTVNLGDALTFTASATDVDLPEQTLAFSLVGAPANALINGATGAFTWTPTVAQAGSLYTFKVRVTDGVGGSAEEQISVGAAYTMTGALSPVQNGGSYNAGRTLPVKFKLTGASAGVTNAVARLWVSKVPSAAESAATPAGGSNTGNLFRYDAGDGQYIFNWDTKGLAPGTYRLRIDTGDGVTRAVTVTLN